MFDPAPRRRHHPFRMKMLRARHQDPTAPKLRLRKLGAHSWTEAITRPPRSACLQLSHGPWDEPARREDEPPVEAGSTWVPLEIEICIVSAPGDISHGALAGLPRRGTLVTAEHAEGSGCQGPASPRHYRGRSAVAIKDLRPLEPELRRGTVIRDRMTAGQPFRRRPAGPAAPGWGESLEMAHARQQELHVQQATRGRHAAPLGVPGAS